MEGGKRKRSRSRSDSLTEGGGAVAVEARSNDPGPSTGTSSSGNAVGTSTAVAAAPKNKEEEMRKRRERLKAWQEAKAKKEQLAESSNGGEEAGGSNVGSAVSHAGSVTQGRAADPANASTTASTLAQAATPAKTSIGIIGGSSGTIGGLGVKRRANRLRASKWDDSSKPGTVASSSSSGFSAATVSKLDGDKSGLNGSLSGSSSSGAFPVAAGGGAADEDEDVDPLEAFMSSLYDGGDVAVQKDLPEAEARIAAGVSAGDVDRVAASAAAAGTSKPNVITFEEIMAGMHSIEESSSEQKSSKADDKGNTAGAGYNTGAGDTAGEESEMDLDTLNRGWESDAGVGEQGSRALYTSTPVGGSRTWVMTGTDDEEEDEGFGGRREGESEAEWEERQEREKQEFLIALRKAREEEDQMRDRLRKIEEKAAATAAAKSASKAAGAVSSSSSASSSAGIDRDKEEKKAERSGAQLGRVFAGEGDMIEEHEVDTGKRSALEILEEARRGKMLKEVDHAKIEYAPFRKNLYIVPRALSKLSEEEVGEIREDLHIKVRGRGCPAPVSNWEQCGLSDRILQTVTNLKLKAPFPIQKQAIPAIMCGRDVIGVAKTGSGKTLAFLLPMLRHIMDQPPLLDGEGPIGLIMAPARELAFQIYHEAKKFTKPLGLRVACIYGGAGVAEQIADLKRGSEIVVCTPGRMIDILCMQAGKLVSLRRVTMVVMDEADRMFDMGFEPQIKMIIQNVRPDRQTVLFSATFPKQIEKLAKTVLRLPLEIVVGERSTVNKDITQVIEVHEEDEKFLRLLQLLGIWYEKGSVLVFVDKQEKCDQLFQDLLKLGYPCLSLHGGKDQVDRDHTLHEFKTGIKTVMIATSVAGRGLDVPDIVCVVNFNCPNHLEEYVHRVGRTGRAGRKGTAYTFLSQKEEQYAPIMIKVLNKAGVPVPEELAALAATFKEKVSKGEAHWSSNGFDRTKGFTFDASEQSEAQKVASMQRKAYAIEQGIMAPADVEDDGDDADDEGGDDDEGGAAADGGALGGSSASSGAAGPNGTGNSNGSSAAAGAAAAAVPVITSNMTPLERAKAMAAQIAAKTGVAAAVASSTGMGGGAVTVDKQAALAKARQLAQQLERSSGIKSYSSGGGGGGGAGEGAAVAAAGAAGSSAAPAKDYYAEELDINDYPPQARRKIANKNALDDITERTGVAIISRGQFIPAGRKIEGSERRLHLLIEGNSEMSVRQARLDILRVLEEETLRISSSTSLLGSAGRYSVL